MTTREPGHGPDHRHEPDHEKLRERLVEAAIEAEQQTGRHEETIAEARRGVLARLARMSLGSLLLVAGAAMLVLPGPGWLVIAAGLAVLSRDVAWAERTLAIVRRRLPADADGRVPARVWVVAGAATLAFGAAGIWWTVR